ncbi:MAG: pyridoxal-phosphate dependent enzyme [Polyangia bacterium]
MDAVRETPLVPCALGCLLKLESLQRTGSFKLRGALAALRALAADGVKHVVAASAGNHGLGMACAGAALGIAVTVVVPENAVEKKRAGIRAYGAELIIAGAGYDDAERAARKLSASRGLPFVSPFDDEHVIAGNGGSLGEELLRQRPSLRRVVVPVGGGGLVAGLIDVLAPHGIEVIGVQPRGASAMARSLGHGAAQLVDDGITVCSGLDGGVSERTYARAQKYQLRIQLVEEADVLPAIAYAYRALGQLVEPASAVVIAAVRAGLVVDDETALVITGGNLEPSLLEAALLT